MIWLPVWFGSGIAFFFILDQDPSNRSLVCLLVCIGVCGVLLKAFPRRWSGLYILVWIGAGFLMVHGQTQFLAHRHHMVSESWSGYFLGEVRYVEPWQTGWRLLVRPVFPAELVEALGQRGMVRLTSRQKERPGEVGGLVRGKMTVLPVSEALVPGGFSYRRQAFFEGIGGVGYSEGYLKFVPSNETSFLSNLRLKIYDTMIAAIPGQAGVLAAALVTGFRGTISRETNQAFNDSGLAHILSISGLHFALLAGVVFLVCRRVLTSFPWVAHHGDTKKIAACCVIGIAFLYMIVAGAAVPVVRSFLMIACVMGAILVDREPISMRLVAFAALVILVVMPEALLTASFQMSFAAVIALVAYYEHAARRASSKHFMWRYVKGVVVTTLIATGATAPFTLWHFGRLSVFSAIANLLAVPLTALWIMPCLCLVLLLMPFGWESFFCRILGMGLELLLKIATLVSSWPTCTVQIAPLMPMAEMVFIGSVVIKGLVICLARSRRRWWVLSLIPLIVGASCHTWSLEGFILRDPFAALVKTSQGITVVSGHVSEFIKSHWYRAAHVQADTVKTTRMSREVLGTQKIGECYVTGGWLPKQRLALALPFTLRCLPSENHADVIFQDPLVHLYYRVRERGMLTWCALPPSQRIWGRGVRLNDMDRERKLNHEGNKDNVSNIQRREHTNS